MKLWSGRLDGHMDGWMAVLNNSLPIDNRLVLCDITASIAWAAALEGAQVLSAEESQAMTHGLLTLKAKVEQGALELETDDEDIHTLVERELGCLIGDLAGKLHTGRSRNDQVSTDFRLWCRQAVHDVIQLLEGLQHALLQRAKKDFDIIIPGYTHTQQAQPVLLAHWWLSHFWAFQRDKARLTALLDQVNILPLGSAALAGSGFPVDRFQLAQNLGFTAPSPNSIDAVSDRDFSADFLYSVSLSAVHLSRLSEMLILFSTQEFGYVQLDDRFSTGSSIMPHKKNPDPLELIRAKAGTLIGLLAGFLSVLKALPSAYDKDLQEDKKAVFEAYDTFTVLLKVMTGLVSTLFTNQGNMKIHPYMMATDLADELVTRGVPFRQAHHLVASAVRYCEENKIAMPDLPLPVWQSLHPLFDEWVYSTLNPALSIKRHTVWGGTAPSAVEQQLAYAERVLSSPQTK